MVIPWRSERRPPAVRRLAVRRVLKDDNCNTPVSASQARNHNIWWCGCSTHHKMMGGRVSAVRQLWTICWEVVVCCGRGVDGAGGRRGGWLVRCGAYRPSIGRIGLRVGATARRKGSAWLLLVRCGAFRQGVAVSPSSELTGGQALGMLGRRAWPAGCQSMRIPSRPGSRPALRSARRRRESRSKELSNAERTDAMALRLACLAAITRIRRVAPMSRAFS